MGKTTRSLSLRCVGCSPLKNWGCLFDVGDAEEDQRSIRSGLQAAICVVDIDAGLSQAGCYVRDLSGPVRNLGVDDFYLYVRQSLTDQHRLGCRDGLSTMNRVTLFPPIGKD